jgi:hypothetical protein
MSPAFCVPEKEFQVKAMTSIWRAPRAAMIACIGLAAGLASVSESRSQGVPAPIADQESVFVDGRTFEIVLGRAKPDTAARIGGLRGRDLGPGAIIYRSGDHLYILGAPLVLERGGQGGPEGLLVDAEHEQLGRIRVQYDPPKNPEHQQLYQRLKELRVLETIQEILSPLRLPAKGLVIKTLGCGVINSWYNDDDPGDSGPTVHMCYELLRNIIKTTSTDDLRPNVTRHDAIVGQFLFWTLHETGHAVYDIFQLPLFGREEDAADLFAGYMMLHLGRDQARRWVEGAAYSAQEFMKDFGPADNYSSVHGLPQQRFYNLICLAYGADPVTFADVTKNLTDSMSKQGVLPKQRADDCEYEFQTFDRAFRTQIRPHVDLALAKAVMDTSWFPEPRHQRLHPAPAPQPAATPATP